MSKYCAISIMCRDENQYLEEWIDYHLLIGFDHIQIWDNESKIPIRETVKKYIQNKTVSVKEIKGLVATQRQCSTQYQSCSNTLKSYHWVALLDTDEFIVLLDKETNIKQYLKKFEQFGSVGLSWLMFNSNGHEHTQKSQIESFTECHPGNLRVNQHVKSIVNTKHFISSPNPHYVMSNKDMVDVKGRKMKRGPFLSPAIHNEGMRINHYYTRSKEDWKLKQKRGAGGRDNSPSGLNKDGLSKKYTQKVWDGHHAGETVQNYDIINLVKRIKNEQNTAGNNDV